MQIKIIAETERLWIMLSDENDGWPVLKHKFINNLFKYAEGLKKVNNLSKLNTILNPFLTRQGIVRKQELL